MNIGVLVGSDEGNDWAFKHVNSFHRANMLGGDAGRMQSFLSIITDQVGETLRPPDLFGAHRRLTVADIEGARAHQGNAVQFSPPQIVAADDAEQALSIMYPVMVEEPPARHRLDGRRRLLRALHTELKRVLPRGEAVMNRNVSSRADKQRGTFDLILHADGQYQLAQAWSFKLRDIDYAATQQQSWAWFVSEFRRQGAIASMRKGKPVALRHDTPLVVVHDYPETNAQQEVFESARASWHRLGLAVHESAEIGDAVREIESHLKLTV